MLGHVCKTHPDQYLRQQVLNAFDAVFEAEDPDYKKLVLRSFLDFLAAEEKLSEDALSKGKAAAASKESIASADYDPGRLTGASTATSHDGYVSSEFKLREHD